jgi:hypothetical protein
MKRRPEREQLNRLTVKTLDQVIHHASQGRAGLLSIRGRGVEARPGARRQIGLRSKGGSHLHRPGDPVPPQFQSRRRADPRVRGRDWGDRPSAWHSA